MSRRSCAAACGILTMLNNTGQMLSIAIVFPLALSAVPAAAMMQVFIYGGGMSKYPLPWRSFCTACTWPSSSPSL